MGTNCHPPLAGYRQLLRVEKEAARNIYLEECITGNWSTRQLERQIGSFFYKRLMSSKNKERVRSEIQTLKLEKRLPGNCEGKS